MDVVDVHAKDVAVHAKNGALSMRLPVFTGKKVAPEGVSHPELNVAGKAESPSGMDVVALPLTDKDVSKANGAITCEDTPEGPRYCTCAETDPNLYISCAKSNGCHNDRGAVPLDMAHTDEVTALADNVTPRVLGNGTCPDDTCSPL